jgi:hypothetical protein
MNAKLKAILSQYEEKTTVSTGFTRNAKADLSNYFSTYLPKGVKEATKVVRLLPGGETPFAEVLTHTHGKDFRKYMCPKTTDSKNDCPFCETFEGLMAKDTEEHRKLAYKTYKAREAYVVKVIDREKESEGVKFWRFNHSRQKDGIYDQIINSMVAAGEDFTDPDTGRDLTIKISRNQANIPVVSSIIASFKQTPLHEDESTKNLWLADEREWTEVYSVKPYEFLRILVEDGEPGWDKENKKWIDKSLAAKEENASNDDTSDLENELVMGGSVTAATATTSTNTNTTSPNTTTNAAPTTPAVDVEEEEDDLPF